MSVNSGESEEDSQFSSDGGSEDGENESEVDSDEEDGEDENVASPRTDEGPDTSTPSLKATLDAIMILSDRMDNVKARLHCRFPLSGRPPISSRPPTIDPPVAAMPPPQPPPPEVLEPQPRVTLLDPYRHTRAVENESGQLADPEGRTAASKQPRASVTTGLPPRDLASEPQVSEALRILLLDRDEDEERDIFLREHARLGELGLR